MGSAALGVTLPWQDSIDHDDGLVQGKGAWGDGPFLVSSSTERGFTSSHIIPDSEVAWNFQDVATLDAPVDSGMLYFGYDSASDVPAKGRADLLREKDGGNANAMIAFRPSLAGDGIEPSTA